MICKICKNKTEKIFATKIVNKYNIDYFHCRNCHFIQTEEPHWLEEVYKESINTTDVGYIGRNIYYSEKITILLYLLFGKKGKFLDYAAGYGVFVRIMRDIGFDFYWDDIYTSNLFAKGFEFDKKTKSDAIICLEGFEHFLNPIEEIESMLEISKTIIFSTNLVPSPIPKPLEWWYYGLEHGQHISLYSLKTMKYIADKYTLNYYSINNLHIITDKKISGLKLFLIKFNKLFLHKFIQKKLKSKTWEDYSLLSNKLND